VARRARRSTRSRAHLREGGTGGRMWFVGERVKKNRVVGFGTSAQGAHAASKKGSRKKELVKVQEVGLRGQHS